jgi:hypothetical protein
MTMSESTFSSQLYLFATLCLLLPHLHGGGSVLSNPRKHESQSSAMRNIAGTSDREKNGLRGPVRSCTEERTFDFGKIVTTTEYDPDGRILSQRTVNADGPESVNTKSYDTEGRLLRSSWGKPGAQPASEAINSYDDKGRLLSVTHRSVAGDANAPITETIESYSYDESGRLVEIAARGEDGSHSTFEYDRRGGKTMIRTFAPKKPQDKLVGFAGSPFDIAQAGHGIPDGASVTIIYNNLDVPSEVQVHDSEGHFLSRITRSYNAQGQVGEDKQVIENPEFMLRAMLPAEARDQLPPGFTEEAKVFFRGKDGFYGTSYTYDAQNRQTLMRRWFGPTCEEITTTYNEHGDKAEEHSTYSQPAAAAEGPPGAHPSSEPQKQSEVRYSYEYDSQGNWTEETMTSRSSLDESFKASNTYRRKLTYF